MQLSVLLLCVSVPLSLGSNREEQDEQERVAHVAASRPRANQPTGVDWWQRGQNELNQVLGSRERNYAARNVIYVLGDGMGVSTLTASRIFNAQQKGQSVTEGALSWEQFPYSGMVKTYSSDTQVPDSAATATAFLCGEKTIQGVISVNENVLRGDCASMAGNELRSLFHLAQDSGKWVGLVSTSVLVSSTLGCAFANSPERDWKGDIDVPAADWAQCPDLAYQFVHREDNKQLRVVLTGGRENLLPNTTRDPEYPSLFGRRGDGRDLIQDWKNYKLGEGLREGIDFSYVENTTDFNNVDPATTEYLLGIFEYYSMKMEADRREETVGSWAEPSLPEMVKKALDILKKAPNGFILMAEGDRIDSAHHGSTAYRALLDTAMLSEAAEVAMNETSEDDTLIVVTADHSHPFTMAGYQGLENDILGMVRDPVTGELELADDGKPYLTLGYNNGPGFEFHRTEDGSPVPGRRNITNDDTLDKDYLQDTGLPYPSSTHAGEDLAVYARGPMAHLFRGQHEQSYIAHAAMYAACIGPNLGLCTP